MEKFLAKQAASKAATGANADAAAATEAAAAPTKKDKKVKEPRSAPEASKAAFVATPKGEKKDMSQPMADSYEPDVVEASWYDWWENQGFFDPQTGPNGEISPKGQFVIASPPPNVTGKLHIGHAMTIAIQDSLVRWNRMRGLTTLFIPGSDHAGISTQVVVEQQLRKQEGLSRHDLGREAFVDKVWDWKNEYGNIIMSQVRRLGTSYDWNRERFTLDEMMSRATFETFVRLYDDGIIYRSNRLVNWCHALNTTLSNLEVENLEIPGRTLMSVPGYPAKEKFEFGVLVHFAYQVENSDERIVVATTRIETMLGDSAIAVHPEDPRYTHLHGKFVVHPFLDRRIPIIADPVSVDMAFGTGAVKITPAHDNKDYEMGKRHNLNFINLLNEDGTYNDNAGPYAGMLRFHVRRQIVEDLKAKGLYVDTTNNPMVVPICIKSKDIIEPMIKPQWWVKSKTLADPAIEAARDGRLEIIPQSSEKEWYHWLENIHDWCISRQLWWGHRIPAYFVRIAGQNNDPLDQEFWVVGRDKAEAQRRAAEKFPGIDLVLEQDPDVLDTWFSSGLWPFAVLGWPENTDDFKKYYPTSLLETGSDIIFFWVARMVMLGMYLTGEVPFPKVYCHAMVRDAQGRKMSKSLGNVLDPIDVIKGISLESLHAKLMTGNLDSREVELAKKGQTQDFPNGIPECGSDALRFTLCAYTSAGRDVNLNIMRVDGYRKFCNKLWNATRFALMKLGEDFVPSAEATLTGNESLAERWILQRINATARDVNPALAEMNFMVATTAVHSFWLYDLCDVYIEYIKPITMPNADPVSRNSALQTLYTCLDQGLKMLHPFMPYVTEELWQRLPRRASETSPTISLATYPEIREDYDNSQVVSEFELAMSIAKAGRSLTASYNVLSKSKFYVSNANTSSFALTSSQADGIATMIKGCQSIVALKPGEAVPAGCAVFSVNDEVAMHLLVRGSVDIEQEVAKLGKKIAKTTKLKDSLTAKVSIPKYEETVPEEVRESNSAKLSNYDAEIDALQAAIKTFLTLEGAE
ncbi:tRNA synthetases class I-domain-containing protein [Kickxella alabastrina]|uniref:tRNA synthetases class I-domain-containing protein n=1 Tax=Kickxella alabastrina TaxID=61397 RepID=UPI00221F17A5|nr:tRNA synthetases class I-domain-containing protein [Kickxella alabastrina]KAI7833353.1 tRNA synthetases class I-domain-containing protein [Kickxella alabastrina]